MDVAGPGKWPHCASRPIVRFDQFRRTTHQLADPGVSASHRVGLPDCQPCRCGNCRGLELQLESRVDLAPMTAIWRKAIVRIVKVPTDRVDLQSREKGR